MNHLVLSECAGWNANSNLVASGLRCYTDDYPGYDHSFSQARQTIHSLSNARHTDTQHTTHEQ